jgi:hypothetical protein
LLPLPTEVTCGPLIEYHMTLANLRRGRGDARLAAASTKKETAICIGIGHTCRLGRSEQCAKKY